jgi:hypothetical protein
MGILFKFAQDTNLASEESPVYLYGGKVPSDGAAMKGAGHELKG